MKKRRRWMAASFVLLPLLLLLAAAPQESEPILQIFSATPQVKDGHREVAVLFTFLNRSGAPVTGLHPENITVMEDDQPAQVLSVESSDQNPARIILLLDTSGSMMGNNIEAAREAALAFIRRLRPEEDQIAIIAFDSKPRMVADFTADPKAASDYLTMVEATPNGGTCLYDALWQAISMIQTLTPRRYTIILLTDGRDEIDNHLCSTHSLDETAARLQGESALTLYTLGLGQYADDEALDRLATAGHGLYLRAPSPDQLQALFNRIEGQMRFQYTLTYYSTAPAGWHRVTLNAQSPSGLSASATIDVEMPAVPCTLKFESPTADEPITQPTIPIKVQVLGENASAAGMRFFVNGEEIGEDTTPPFEIEWSPPETFKTEKPLTITAILYDQEGQQIASQEATFTYQPDNNAAHIPTLALICLGGIFILLIVGGVIFGITRRKQQQKQDTNSPPLTHPPSSPGTGETQIGLPSEGFAVDNAATSPPRAFLVVRRSDNALLIGRRLEIVHPKVRLGRRSDNDIAFPRDSAVSRYHAIIEERDGQFFISEVIRSDNTGRLKGPKYGTFVNDTALEGREVPLRHGAIIRLGPRLTLEFRLPDEYSADDMTMDFTRTQHQDDDATQAT